MGAKGEDRRDAVERLRAQGRESVRLRLRFIFAAVESRHGRRGKAFCLNHRQRWSDSIRRKQRRRERAAKLRQDQSETGGAEVTKFRMSELCHPEQSAAESKDPAGVPLSFRSGMS